MKGLELDNAAERVIKEAAPVYLSEIREVVTDLKLLDAVAEEAKALLSELRPEMRRQLERVRPRVEGVLQAQRERTMASLEELLQLKLNSRLVRAIDQQSGRLQQQTGLDEEALAQLIENLHESSALALAATLDKRKGDVEEEMRKIGWLVEEIPQLPPKSEERLLSEIRDVLLALIKNRLPDYHFEALAPGELPMPAPRAGPPPEVQEARKKAAEKAAEAAAEAGAPEEVVEKLEEAAEKPAGAGIPESQVGPPPEVKERVEEVRKAAEEARKKAMEESAEEPTGAGEEGE
ncbi:MAG: hypothetical protein ACYS1C_06105 [Planctomycetota bacterium]